MTVRIYHNPRCSKSRQTLQLLRDRGVEPQIIEYLNNPLTVDEIRGIVKKLNITPMELVRQKEKEFVEAGLDQGTPSEEQVITAIHSYPKLLERPIVVSGDHAAIGRPPESVLAIL